MRCVQCGTELGDGAVFCHNCGTVHNFDKDTYAQRNDCSEDETAIISNYNNDETELIISETTSTNMAREILWIKSGTVLHNRYTIQNVLGCGGFGITYVGIDNLLQIKVAVKEFFPRSIVTRNNTVSGNVECIGNEEIFNAEKSKVINEARILAKFSKTQGIVNVLEYFEENNTAYIVMEFLEGSTLKNYIKNKGCLSADYAFSLIYPIMRVVSQLHKENVIHRDISPDNIMFDGEQLKLLDFGAARELFGNSGDELSVVLKHGYAPEEQYSRKGFQGPWTDVYSICATLYYCITGVKPNSSLERLHVDELQKPSELGADISYKQETALLKGLGIYPENRFQSIDEFVSAWNEQGASDTNDDNVKPYIKTKEKNNKGIIVGVIAGIIIVVLAIACAFAIINHDKSLDDDRNELTLDMEPSGNESDANTESTTNDKVSGYTYNTTTVVSAASSTGQTTDESSSNTDEETEESGNSTYDENNSDNNETDSTPDEFTNDNHGNDSEPNEDKNDSES